MANLTAHVRLRPIRFGFLVIPDDGANLLEIFRVNTCLWGGKFNPIIPHLPDVPDWWDRHGHRFETAPQISSGYLDFFEPDFLVEATPGLAADLGFDLERVLPLPEILHRDGERHKQGHGESVLGLYRDLYRKEFQFARRHEHDIINVTPEDLAFTEAAACLAGSFPRGNDLAYFGRAFTEAFEPKPETLNGATLARLYETGFTSALRLGHSGLEIDNHGWHEPALFVFDALRPSDLIDLWNLRAVRGSILPVPVQWLPDLAPFCRKVIADNYRPRPANPHGVMIRATVMFGRAIPTADIEALYTEHLRVDIQGANVRQDWYPSLWHRPSRTDGPREMRPTLIGARKSFNTPAAGGTSAVQFDSLHPDWSEQHGAKHRWANVVKIEDWTFRDVAATVFPNDRQGAFLPRFRQASRPILSTTEGIVIFPRFKNIPEHWDLPDGDAAIAEWLKANGIDSVASDAGRATRQIIETLGGFNSVGDLAKKGVLETLEEMARRPITRSAHFQKFRNQISNAVKGDIWHERSFHALVERNAVELGLEVRCANCSSWNWYALDALGYKLRCNLCRRDFAFPITDPGQSDNTKWSYRVVGPFALPDYARGGYAAALALRCLSDIVGGHHEAKIAWSAGRELTLATDQKVEADAIVWYQRKSLLTDEQDSRTDILFGEAKSFGKDAFKNGDVANMKALAERFPGAVLVFATLRPPTEMSETELAAMRELALWGREYTLGEYRSRSPVILLTAIELFAGYSLTDAWKETGGRHAEFAKAAWLRADNLRVLADITQQLYLALPSYSEWHRVKWEAIHAERAAADAIAQASTEANSH